MSMEPADRSPGIRPRLVLVMALASGLVVANSYYAQPVVGIIADTFEASTTSVGLVITASQVGRSEEHTSELQSRGQLVCRLPREKNKISRYPALSKRTTQLTNRKS